MTMQSALIVDDHPLFCDALAMTLKAFVGIGRIDTADRIDTAVERLGGGPLPDVVVLDLNLPDVHGMERLVRIRHVSGAVPAVVVSSMADARVIGAALNSEAPGFV
ncbi:MAG: response regulator transcription factor, partial [Rhodobacteraceae bacterium]|nr:response regulator transcription factor [Paracoccaceae bacterium]